MTSLSKPTIVFDLGGVLFDWNPRYLFRKMFNGRSEEMAYFLNNVCTPDWNGEMDKGRPFAEAVASKIAEFPEYQPFIRAYQTRWPEMIAGSIDGTVAILAEFHHAGYQTAALSNWPPDTFSMIQPQYDFLNWFDEIVLSNEHKVVKPDPAIYQIVLAHLGKEAGECIFIDDLIANVNAAKALGFQGIHFQSPSQLRADLKKLGLLCDQKNRN